MSDEEDFDESEGSDFSVSEEEWQPSKVLRDSSDFETEDEMEDVEIDAVPGASSRRNKNPRNKMTKKMNTLSLRSRMFNKYKPPPKIIVSPTNLNQSPNLKLAGKLEKAAYKEEKECKAEESDSSGDDYLVDPATLDLKSSFFDVLPKNEYKKEEPPKFDCNAGMRLSDSEDEDDNCVINEKKVFDNEIKMETSEMIGKINKHSSNKMRLVHDYTKYLENAKEHLRNFKSDTFKDDNVLDVNKLLALGESSSLSKDNKRGAERTLKKRKHDSDSDWEEVEDIATSVEKVVENDELQITVQFPQRETRNKKSDGLEAALKRKINRIIKENQMCLHKVSLLCHIAHGIYCNQLLNKTYLMAEALKLLPSANSYPNGRTDINYFQQMSRWYKTVISVKKNQMYSYLRTKPRLDISLALQIKTKAAICKKDFVLIYIILLRAMGIQCRLVMNLAVLPIRPSQSDLCSLKQKKDDSKMKVKEKEKVDGSTRKELSKPKVKVIEKETKYCEDKPLKTDHPSRINISKKVTSTNKEKSKGRDNIPGSTSKQIMYNNEETSKTKKPTTQRRNASKAESGNKKGVQVGATSNTTEGKVVKSELFVKKDSNCKNENSESQLASKKGTKEVKRRKKGVSNPIIDSEKVITSKHFSKNNEENITNDQRRPLIGRSTRSKTRKLKINDDNIPQLDGADDIPKRSRRRKSNVKSINLKKLKSTSHHSNSEDDFVPCPPKKTKSTSKEGNLLNKLKKIDKRVLSTDNEDEDQPKVTKNKMDVWVEVFSEVEDQWVTIDLFKSKVHCVDAIRKSATTPIAYVFAWNNDNSMKDVSARYCPQWHTVTRKLRVEQCWLDDAVQPYLGKKTSRDKAEDRELRKIHIDKPLPQTISEYKNHPLYALERHLLKFEGIYPPNALTLGFVRGEPVYARECVHTLHSREIWLKAARVVKLGEQPYKVVKARPKWDKLTNTVIKDKPLEIFGFWQTNEYDPPTAENGIVPRNAYGNVDLFKKSMLPKKTVHLQLPGLNRVCKKLQIDCAPAVVGFDFHQGACHPLLDGFVVCEEFADQVVEAWEKDREEAERRQEEKYAARVYGNWKKLIRGLLIREKLKIKYNFGGQTK